MELKLCGSTHCGVAASRRFSFRKTLVHMKLLIIFTMVASLQAWSSAHAQTITLSVRNVPLEQVFTAIEQQCGTRFIYTREELKAARPVTLDLQEAPLQQALEACFNGQPLSYSLTGKQVIVKKKAATAPVRPGPVLVDVKGRVVNEAGDPLEGISVRVKGTTLGTSTDDGGYFELKDVDGDGVLVFTGVNIDPYETSIKQRQFLLVRVNTRISKLDELQVIAYGTATKRFNVGSVAKVSSDEINTQSATNPLQALKGRVAGLSVASTSGLAGASFRIQVRGQNSVNPEPDAIAINPRQDNPLFIVDGVPFGPQNANVNLFNSPIAPNLSTDPSINNPFGGISPFDNINPDDIESIEVLKDADATAIYGSRAANGVILITTKKGKTGAARLNFKIDRGWESIPKTIQMMNTAQYLALRQEAFANDAITPNSDPGTAGYAPDLTVFENSRYTNWANYFLGRTAAATNIYGSATAGTKNTQFLLATGFHQRSFIFPGDFEYSGASFNTNISHQTDSEKLTLQFSSIYSFNNNNLPGGPGILSAFRLEPNYPDLQNSTGELTWEYNGISLGDGVTTTNPLSYIKRKYQIGKYNLVSNFQVAYKLQNHFTIRTNFGYNSFRSKEYSGSPKSSFDPSRNLESSAQFGNTWIESWIIEPQLEFKKELKPGKLNILLGTSFQQDRSTSIIVAASGYQNDALLESISAASTKTIDDHNLLYKYVAAFGRVNFVSRKRYIFNLSGRRDGSSRFGPNRQFGNFGAIGSGWIFSEEPFVKKTLQNLSYGKLHVSYGSTGSDAIGDYQYIPRWRPTNYTAQGSIGYLPQNLFNPTFSWAVTRKFETGLSVGLFRDRVLTDLTWYCNRSGNQLVSYPLPTQTGFSSVVQNSSALVQNTGWEIQVTTTNVRTKNWMWTTAANISIPKNKLIAFPGIENSSYKNQYIVGQPLSVIYKFRYLGINDSTGLFQFQNRDKVAVYDPQVFEDYQVIGNLDPVFFGGIGNHLRLKQFELDIFLEFRKQTGINYLGAIYSSSAPGYEANQPVYVVNHWKKPGDQAEFQKLTTVNYSDAGQARSHFLKSSGMYSDASYVRVSNINLSYSLPLAQRRKLHLASCRFYIMAQNVFTVTNYKGNDPETQNFYGVPVMRALNAGIQLTF